MDRTRGRSSGQMAADKARRVRARNRRECTPGRDAFLWKALHGRGDSGVSSRAFSLTRGVLLGRPRQPDQRLHPQGRALFLLLKKRERVLG
jgi:hypothetical protein